MSLVAMRPCHSHYASQLGAWAGRRRTDRGTAHKIPGDPLLPAGPALRPCPYHVASATRTRFRLEKGTTYSCMRGAWSGTQKIKKKKKNGSVYTRDRKTGRLRFRHRGWTTGRTRQASQALLLRGGGCANHGAAAMFSVRPSQPGVEQHERRTY
jgi:hypothetical protein